ncbi:MAG: CdaR family protein [Aggregatilineales bacterium]
MSFRSRQFNRTIINNLLWFLASLGLAIFVWIIATTQSDPIATRTITGIPIQYDVNDDLVLVGNVRNSVRVTVRAQQSVLNLLTTDDILIEVDLIGMEAGTHTVELTTRTARRAVIDTQPAQVTVTLEPVSSKLVDIRTVVEADPPQGFQSGDIDLETTQVLVRGATSLVQQVTQAEISVNLSEERTDFTSELPLAVVDSNGDVVNGVTIQPQSVSVNIPISQRTDVDIVGIEPDIDTETLEAGYELTFISYDPQNIIIIGNPESLPSTLLTERISLTDRTTDFVETVSVRLPANLVVLSERNVTVSIGISPIIVTRTFENVRLTVIGLEDGLTADLQLDEVDIIVTGPQTQLDGLSSGELQAVVDLNGLGTGTFDVTPTTSISPAETQIVPESVRVTIGNQSESTENPPVPTPLP